MNKSYNSTNPQSPPPPNFNNTYPSGAPRPGSRPRKTEPSLTPLVFVAVAFLCFSIGLAGFAYYRNVASRAPAPVSPLQATSTPGPPTCQTLINQAISYTGKYCDHIGPNEACYGNVTIQAQMIANTSPRVSQRGDIVDMNQIASISAAPLNLNTEEWGIAIFRMLGNVPGSVPGETVTLMVFGNTKLDKSSGLDSFYFSSQLGQIVCKEVPMDGLMVTMPEGTGWIFKVNGTKLTLIGNASLTASQDGEMVVSLYKGAAAITSQGQTQYFGAGEKVSVQLGGANGTQAVSPPSEPQPLSADEIALACATTGRYCTADAIPTVSAADAQMMIQSGQALDPSAFGTPVPSTGSGGSGQGGSQTSPTPNCYGVGTDKCSGENPGQGGKGH